MLIRHQLAPLRKLGQWRALPAHVVAFYQIDALGREYEETAIYKAAVATRLFDKGGDLFSRSLKRAIFARRRNRGDGRELAVPGVKFDRCLDVDIAESVTIGETKSLLIPEIVADALEPATRLRLFSRIDQSHAPGLRCVLVHQHDLEQWRIT